MRPETVMIETENGPVMINKSEFNPDEHKLLGKSAPVPAAPVAVDKNGNPVNAGDGGEMVPPQGGNETPPAPVTMVVQKKGKKFVVINKETGEAVSGVPGVDEAGYADENAAWIAVASATSQNAG